jgi:MFS family permease
MTRADTERRLELRRLYASAFAADLALNLVYASIPFKALHLGASPLSQGSLGAAVMGAYALMVRVSGRASDRLPRLTLARLSCVGILAGCLAVTTAASVTQMLLAAPLLGGSVAFFWPCVQASVGDRSSAAELGGHLSRFNLSWSTGKGCGFFLAGALLARFGPAFVITVASCVAFCLFFVLPFAPFHATRVVAAVPDVAPRPDNGVDRARRFRRMAWLANGAAYGVSATLTYHYPRLVEAHGWSPRVFGFFAGGIYATQTLVFLASTRLARAWQFRRAPLYAPQLCLVAGIVSLPLASGARLATTAVVFGLALAACYTASIYYSLLGRAERGRNAGMHESLIGVGSMCVPLIGGAVARATASAWAPYVVAGGVVLLSIVAQEAVLRAPRARGSGEIGGEDDKKTAPFGAAIEPSRQSQE